MLNFTFFPFPSSYLHNLNILKKHLKIWAFKKVNLNIKMDFMNLKFEIKIQLFLKDFFLLDFFILSVMVFQCVVVKSCRPSL
jgi:hypothetical protein